MEYDFWNICGILTLSYGLGAAVLFTIVQYGFIELCLAAILRRTCRRLQAADSSQRDAPPSITHDRQGLLNVSNFNGSYCMCIDSTILRFCVHRWRDADGHWRHSKGCKAHEHSCMPILVQVCAYRVSDWGRKPWPSTVRVLSTSWRSALNSSALRCPHGGSLHEYASLASKQSSSRGSCQRCGPAAPQSR